MKRPPGYDAQKFQLEARHNPTEPEKRLWNAVRNRQVNGAKFRQQTWIGPFLVDLYRAEAKLVVEVDGDTPAHQRDYDVRRTAWLEGEGFRVIRFSNDDVVRNLEGVVETIRRARTLPSLRDGPLPIPQRGEG